MMKQIALSLVIAVALTNGCRKNPIASNTPNCIREIIRDNESDENWEVGKVDEYQFHDKKVYTFSPSSRIADGATMVRDANCATVCTYGGLGGPSLMGCNGENFPQVAIFIRNIWKQK